MPPERSPEPCRLCDRPFPPDRLTKHHCKPKSKGGTVDDVELVCSQCHGMVHATFTNATLAALYPTHEAFTNAHAKALKRAVKKGWILKPDAELIEQWAEESGIGD